MRKLITLLMIGLVSVGAWGQQWTGSNIILTNPNSYPYGININTTYTGSWAREFSISRNSLGKLVSFGAYATGDLLTYAYIGGNTGSNLAYNSPWITFKPNGYIGIGTTTPSYKLHVNGSGVGISGASGRMLDLISTSPTGSNYIEFRKIGGERTAYIGHGSKATHDFFLVCLTMIVLFFIRMAI